MTERPYNRNTDCKGNRVAQVEPGMVSWRCGIEPTSDSENQASPTINNSPPNRDTAVSFILYTLWPRSATIGANFIYPISERNHACM